MEKIRKNFLSMEDIYKHRIGYQFYDKDGIYVYELTAKSKRSVLIQIGVFTNKTQTIKTVEYINDSGRKKSISNLIEPSADKLQTTIELEKNRGWYDLNFITSKYAINNKKIKYKEYLTDCHNKGMLSTVDLIKRIEELAIE